MLRLQDKILDALVRWLTYTHNTYTGKMAADRSQHVLLRGRVGVLALVFLLGCGGVVSTMRRLLLLSVCRAIASHCIHPPPTTTYARTRAPTQAWLGDGGGISKELGDVMVLAAAFALLVLGLILLRRGHAATTAAALLNQQQQQREDRSCSLVADCFVRTTTASSSSSGTNHAASSSSPSSAGFGTRLRQFLLGSDRPLTLEQQHRRALALARAGVSSSRSGGGSGGGGGGGYEVHELALLRLMEREISPNDWELLSRLDADSTGRLAGATDAELDLLPLHTVGKSEAAALMAAAATTGGGGRDAAGGVMGKGAGSGSSGDGVCCICLEPWEPGDVQRTLPCFHAFHRGCVDPWLKRRFQCPLCNTTPF